MIAIRCWVVVAVFSVAVLLLGFGCATKSEKTRVTIQATNSAPAPPPIQEAVPTNQPVPTAVTTPPVYVPDISHANDPLPDGIFAWDELSKSTDAAADQLAAQFVFNLTNVAKKINLGLATNLTSITNISTVTNSSMPSTR